MREEVARISAADHRSALQQALVAPRRHTRTWGYGPEQFECWTVAADAAQGLLLAYSADPAVGPWCVLEDANDDMGTDATWGFNTLDDALLAFMWGGLRPPGYEVQ